MKQWSLISSIVNKRCDGNNGIDQVLHPNQGCFLIRKQNYKLQSSFLEHFELKASNLDQSGCTNYCMVNQYSYSGISMKNSATLECYCGNQVPLHEALEDHYCASLCKYGEPICGYSGYARIITSKAFLADFRWRSNSDEQRQWCASLLYERSATYRRKYHSLITQTDCLKKMKTLCIAELPGNKWKSLIGAQDVTWFEAQRICDQFAETFNVSTSRLYKHVTNEFWSQGLIEEKDVYWTQLSSLHLHSADSSGTFGELPWADDQPALRNITCIVAVKTNDEIKLSSSDCEAESAFICMSPDAVPSSSKPDKTTTKPAHRSRDIPEFTTASFAVSTASAEIAMTPSKTSTGVIVGVAVGAILVVILLIAVLLGILFLRKKKKTRAEASVPSMAYMNNKGITKAEDDNVYTVEPTRDSKHENGQNQEVSSHFTFCFPFEPHIYNYHIISVYQLVYAHMCAITRVVLSSKRNLCIKGICTEALCESIQSSLKSKKLACDWMKLTLLDLERPRSVIHTFLEVNSKRFSE
ncbi:hypothetical protein CAPTEDRAFT_227228 [Capitella teleta]|uniref:WSC domain-containing protein n=1 Tax=Capitella teleta TaxID=283909 RepID=R7V326_CAPTE|nr:hypothetical protein CAPTEDRAFT_227228 [Capitella teleta]|eukprot:ELU13243.1 hypothetical protein CAPTEDRAFT_227228 [Capitella teleta]